MSDFYTNMFGIPTIHYEPTPARMQELEQRLVQLFATKVRQWDAADGNTNDGGLIHRNAALAMMNRNRDWLPAQMMRNDRTLTPAFVINSPAIRAAAHAAVANLRRDENGYIALDMVDGEPGFSQEAIQAGFARLLQSARAVEDRRPQVVSRP